MAEDPSDEEEVIEEAVTVKTGQVQGVDGQEKLFAEVDVQELVGHSYGVFDSQAREGGSLQDEVQLKTVLKKAEVQYTQNIEKILEEHEAMSKPLEVTHTVSLGDVRKELDKWKASAVKEYDNLTKSKRAFTVMPRDKLPPGCRIVPCKGVYTVKPDKDNLYRRKTRFVACGNHITESNSEVDLFAAGLDATSLRTMLAFNARRKWRTGTTDIRQAFVLARWQGQPVALEPPSIAYELGLANRGDMWFVEQAIYGLRESPALWSQHRDRELRMAKWKAIVNEEEVTLVIWRIVREDDPDGEPVGFLLVYIDDLLIQAEQSPMETFFKWIASRWECDALNVLEENNPIRFLGMELHCVPGGVELAQEGFITELFR